MYLIPNSSGTTNVTTTIPANSTARVQVVPTFTLQPGVLANTVYPGLWDLNLFVSLSSLPANPIYFYQTISINNGQQTINGSTSPTRISNAGSTLYSNSLFVNYLMPTNYNATVSIYFYSPIPNTTPVVVTTYYNNNSTLSNVSTMGQGNMMDLNTTQTVTGDKTFSGTTTITGNLVTGNTNIFTITQFFT